MSLIFVDCEAVGPCPALGYLTEFGAVEFKSQKTFHGVLMRREHHGILLDRVKSLSTERKPDEELALVFRAFEEWLSQFEGRPVFVSDNPAYDWMWICDAFWRLLGRNPFGHSARRISDFYAGLVDDFYRTQKWKRWRRTPHDHDPVHDALGNVEAFKRMLEEFGAKTGYPEGR